MRPTLISVAILAACVSVTHAQQVKQQTRDLKAPQSQTRAQAGSGVIAGTVVSAESGNAVRRAHVTIAGGTPRVMRSVQTDEQGGFRFKDLPSGEFSLTASKQGYVDSTFGEKQPGSGRPGTPIHLADGQERARLSLPLSRGAVITGAVYDEAGEPSMGESVELLKWIMESGERTLESVATATTDDRGIYRFPALQTGEYLVCTVGSIGSGDYDVSAGTFFKLMKPSGAFVSGGNFNFKGSVSIVVERDSATAEAPPASGFSSVYFPGTPDYASAQTVAIKVGEERSGVDFRLQLVPIGSISGVVTGPDGPVGGVEVRLINRGQPPGLHIRTVHAGKDGRFDFSAVTPGQYTLFARATPKTVKLAKTEPVDEPARTLYADAAADMKKRALLASALSASQELWAMTDVSTDGRASEVSLTLQPGMTVSGQVAIEGPGIAPNLARLTITVEPVGTHPFGESPQPAAVPVDANGNFTIRGVMPGKYRIAIDSGAPSGYQIKSAIFGGQDVLDVPLQLTGNERPLGGVVTLSKLSTLIEGTVQTSAGDPASDITVIAFSADSRFWTPRSRRIQASRPSTNGKYSFTDLPPGEYRLVAVSDIEPGRWFDPAVLRALPAILTVTLGENGRVTQNMTIR